MKCDRKWWNDNRLHNEWEEELRHTEEQNAKDFPFCISVRLHSCNCGPEKELKNKR